MRDASLEEGASRQQKIGAISFFFFFFGAISYRLGTALASQRLAPPPSGQSVAPGEGQCPVSCPRLPCRRPGSLSLGPPSSGLGVVRITGEGMAPRWPRWDEMATLRAALLRTDSPANGRRCGQAASGDPGFSSSPPAWSWAQPGFPGWVVPALLPCPRAWTEIPRQCPRPPVSGPLHLTSSHPGMPFHGMSRWKTPPLSSLGCLLSEGGVTPPEVHVVSKERQPGAH